MIDLDYFTLEMKSIAAWQIIVGYWIQSKNEMHLIGKAGFEKVDLLYLVIFLISSMQFHLELWSP
jgi:hypothetical protein